MVDLSIPLPEEFLLPEERCDYLVSAQMKEVWAVELDLLAQLLEVCDRHGIRIFASGGTLLGAVRHQGFIPWDDDIDLALLREDYEQLCRIAPEEFKDPYFFQTEYTDIGSLRGHAQLRNSRTTGMLQRDRECGYRFNQGIFIDIFPLDNVIDDEALFAAQLADAQRYRARALHYAGLSSRYRRGQTPGLRSCAKGIAHTALDGFIAARSMETKAYSKFETACQRYNDRPTDRVSMLSFHFADLRLSLCREDLEEVIEVPFEFLRIPIARRYRRTLSIQYGDYEQPRRSRSYHGSILFDTDRPYSDYFEQGK